MTCFDESISVRGRCSRSLRAVFLLGFLLYGLTVTAQETGRDVSAGTSESLRQKTSSLSEGKQDTVIFRFAPQRRMFWADYKGNAAAIKSLTRSIRQHKFSIESGDMKVRVLGFCSSYDSFKENLAAAKNRSNQVKSYFIVHEGLKEDHFRTTNSTRRWRGMTDVIAVAYMSSNAKADTPPDILSERDVVPSDSPSGDEKSEIRPESETPESSAEPDTPDTETPVEPEPQPAQPGRRDSGRNAVRSRAPLLPLGGQNQRSLSGATVASLGVEYSFGDRYSVDLPVIYSPYTVARDYRLCFLAVQPEFRYWLKKPMEGHFFGVHLHIGAFNIAVDDRNRYQSPDGFYGAGLSYGYMLPFARHWAAEFTIGAGYVRTKYDVYYNIPNGARFEKGVPYNYWGMTKRGSVWFTDSENKARSRR